MWSVGRIHTQCILQNQYRDNLCGRVGRIHTQCISQNQYRDVVGLAELPVMCGNAGIGKSTFLSLKNCMLEGEIPV